MHRQMCREAGAVTIAALAGASTIDFQIYKIYRRFSIAVANAVTADGKVHKRGRVLSTAILEILIELNHPDSVYSFFSFFCC